MQQRTTRGGGRKATVTSAPQTPSLATPLKALAIGTPSANTTTTTTTTTTPGRKTRTSVQLDFEAVAKPPVAVAAAAAATVVPTTVEASSQTDHVQAAVDDASYVLKLRTQDVEEARQAVASARRQKRPLLLQGLLAHQVKEFAPDQLQLLPEDVKVCSDDKTGIGFQPLRDWGVGPKRLRKATTAAAAAAASKDETTAGMPANWGRIASIMSEKGPQARLWTRFMQEDLAAFRRGTGHTSLATFASSVFPDRAPMSYNMIVTGNAAPSATGRQFELKSDAHQDEYDNFMLVTSGAKIWALADLTEEQVAMGRKTKGKLSSSFRLDAVDRTKNRTQEEHEVAGLFDTVFMGPGDVLFNPAWVWHQVNSEPLTLAYSIMYPIPSEEK